MGVHPLRRSYGGRYHLVLAAALLLLLGALGGASRADELQQAFVRVAAILVIAAALWPVNFAPFRDARGMLAGVAAIYLLVVLQLIPLPPDVWARMPGHGIYAEVAERTRSVAWRPWTLSPDLTLNALAALLPATAVILTSLPLDFRGRLALALVIAAIGCSSALLGLLQFAAGGTTLHLFRLSSEDAAVGLFANRNHEAVLMACCLPIVAALAAIRVRKDESDASRPVIAASCAGLLLLVALAATGSRMGLLLGVVGAAAAAAIYMTNTSASRRPRHLWPLGSSIVIAGILPLGLLLSRSGSVSRLTSEPVDQTRIAALGPMLHAARSFFPFGSGFGTFQPVYQHFEPDSLLSTIYLNQAHNEPAQLAIEGGLPALVLLLAFLIWWIGAAARTLRRKDSMSRRALGMAMAATSLILMLSSLVDYPLRTPLLSALFALSCIELVRSSSRAQPSRS